jgi:PadR family transcriptional regulator PadR
VVDDVRLGEFEQLVLLAALQLKDEAYGMEIRRFLQDEAHRRVSRGGLYKTLERLCDKGLADWEVSESTPERGGLPRRRFSVTAAGVLALRKSKETLTGLWSGLEQIIG